MELEYGVPMDESDTPAMPCSYYRGWGLPFDLRGKDSPARDSGLGSRPVSGLGHASPETEGALLIPT